MVWGGDAGQVVRGERDMTAPLRPAPIRCGERERDPRAVGGQAPAVGGREDALFLGLTL